MIDESLPTATGIDSEPKPADRDETPDHSTTDRDESGRTGEPATTDRGSEREPDRATDPPPDRTGGDEARERDRGAACECDREATPEGDGADESDGREYRLERLRLWRTVVTLAVVVARLIRSL